MLHINLPDKQVTSFTKRRLLSLIATIFDPLGLTSPVTITAKIIIQQLWKCQCSCDDPLSQDIVKLWSKFQQSLVNLKNMSVLRHIIPIDCPKSSQLHGFADESNKAYGACCYLVVVTNSGMIASSLVCSKSKVATIKTITLPRLEICAAGLLSRLKTELRHFSHLFLIALFFGLTPQLCFRGLSRIHQDGIPLQLIAYQ